MSRYYNMIGALAWICSRDSAAADELDAFWASSEENVHQVLAACYLGNICPTDRLTAIKEVLRDHGTDGKLAAIGRIPGSSVFANIPATSWLDVRIDEARGQLEVDGQATWQRVRLDRAGLQRIWKSDPTVTPLKPKKPTGPTAKYRSEIKGILDQINQAELAAMERGDELKPRPTHREIAAILSARHGKDVSTRTVSHNVERLGGNINSLLPAAR